MRLRLQLATNATGGLCLIGLCYTLGRIKRKKKKKRSCLLVRNVDNYARTKAP